MTAGSQSQGSVAHTVVQHAASKDAKDDYHTLSSPTRAPIEQYCHRKWDRLSLAGLERYEVAALQKMFDCDRFVASILRLRSV